MTVVEKGRRGTASAAFHSHRFYYTTSAPPWPVSCRSNALKLFSQFACVRVNDLSFFSVITGTPFSTRRKTCAALPAPSPAQCFILLIVGGTKSRTNKQAQLQHCDGSSFPRRLYASRWCEADGFNRLRFSGFQRADVSLFRSRSPLSPSLPAKLHQTAPVAYLPPAAAFQRARRQSRSWLADVSARTCRSPARGLRRANDARESSGD